MHSSDQSPCATFWATKTEEEENGCELREGAGAPELCETRGRGPHGGIQLTMLFEDKCGSCGE